MVCRNLRWGVPALLLALGVLAACAGGGEAIAPTAAPAALAPTAPVDWLQTASMEGDTFVLGNRDAPVRILDDSDFL